MNYYVYAPEMIRKDDEIQFTREYHSLETTFVRIPKLEEFS